MSERIKRFVSNCAVFITAALLLNTFSPYVKSVKAAGTTEIHDENIINIRAHQDGSAFSGELDYHIPSSITEENGIVTYDFSKVLAYSQDASGAFTTNNESALDFSKFTLEGPILIENSIFNSKFENEINEFKNTQDSTALRNAGYPYWYSFDKNGLVELDYTAIFTKNAEGQCDYDTLYDKNTQSFTALSYVVFSCELNKEATTTTTIDETSETSEPSETPTTTEPTGQVKQAERKKILKTGESSSYKEYFALLLLLAATSIFFLVGKKKKSE